MKRYARDKTPYIKPVERIELSEKNIKLRVILMIVFLLLGAGAIAFGVRSCIAAEKGWQKIRLGAWEQQCIGTYDGIAWYRIRFKAPEKAQGVVGAELYFQGVDEIAWIWLNGTYVGQHDLGPAGWDIPFFMNIGEEIKWGEENLLVVRVHDSTAARGIWKPIELHILK
jgi:hypothetical protein